MELNIYDRLDKLESLIVGQGQKKVLTLDETALYTGLSKSHLYKLTSSRGIPCYKPRGKYIYFDRDELEQWLLQNRIKTSEELEAEAATYVTLNSAR